MSSPDNRQVRGRRWLAALAAAGLAGACGHHPARQAGDISSEDADLLNNAAAMLDAQGSGLGNATANGNGLQPNASGN